MPAWWGRKSSKNKEESQNRSQRGTSTGVIKLSPNKTDAAAAAGVSGGGGGSSGKMKAAAAAADDKSHNNSNNYPKSFDSGGGFVLTTGNSPRASKDFSVVGGSSGFSGFDSDSGERIGIPLPTPSGSSMQSDLVVELGSGQPSVSSDCSSDEYQIANDPIQLIAYRSNIDPRGQGEFRMNMRSKSPGPGFRGPTSPTSRLHQLSAVSIESPTGRKEDGKSVS